MIARPERIHSPMIVYFDAIRRAGSVREAARRLNIASSAVNRQLLKLEAELGAPLFERLPGGLRLTVAGAAFARHAIGVLQDAEQVRSELEALRGLRTGHVELAAVEGLSSDLLPDVLQQARGRFPRVTIGVTVMGSTSIPTALMAGDADLGVAFSLDRHPDLRQLSAATFRVGAVMRPDHPLARETSLSMVKCLSHALVLPKGELSIRRVLLAAGSALPAGAIETSSVDLAKQLTLRGLGLSFQTRIGIENELRGGELVHIPITQPRALRSDLGIYVRAARNPPIAVAALADILASSIRGDVEADPEPIDQDESPVGPTITPGTGSGRVRRSR